MSARRITADDVRLALAAHIGADRGISAVELWFKLTGQRVTSGAAARELRQVVEQLRLAGEHVCASPETGYFFARNVDELDATCEHLFHRAMTSLRQVAAMRKVSLPDLRGQLKFKT